MLHMSTLCRLTANYELGKHIMYAKRTLMQLKITHMHIQPQVRLRTRSHTHNYART